MFDHFVLVSLLPEIVWFIYYFHFLFTFIYFEHFLGCESTCFCVNYQRQLDTTCRKKKNPVQDGVEKKWE